MANFESGVSKYIKATATVEVGFPVDNRGNADISCHQCEFFSRQSGICQLTKKISEYPQRYVGSHCPLNIIDVVRKEVEGNV